MVLHSVEDRDENADGALGVVAVGGGGLAGVLVGRSVLTAGKEGAGEVADGGYDYGEVVAAVPEAVVGGLIAEDLGDGGSVWMRERLWGGGTSIRPTTMEREGICEKMLLACHDGDDELEAYDAGW